MNGGPLIELHGATVRFGPRAAIQGVNVAVERGGIPEKEARRILDPGKLTRPGRA